MHAGFITLIGRPNAGKSTLLNAVLGQKISIISAKPQTTRNRILGIYNGEGVQIIMVDTPGIHQAKGKLNRSMVKVATDSLQDVDAICWVLDATGPAHRITSGSLPSNILTKAESRVLALIERSNVENVSIALNKIDLLPRTALLPLIAALSERLPDAVIVPVSALKNSTERFSGGVKRLIDVWSGQLPESPALYPTDQVTDVSERFVVSELIREKIFNLTRQEIPYAVAVEIEKFTEEPREGKPSLYHIMARIMVERDSQKGILIGKQGSSLKRIGTLARKDIEPMLDAPVFLQLHVSVAPKWTENPSLLRELGYES
ncbi:MAG: GTP-binding protein Era [Myxococcota bacterium]|jgi:GTP-binding protein Era